MIIDARHTRDGTFDSTLTMPELPEVEVTRLSFASRIAGAEIKAVALGKPLRWPLGSLLEICC